MASIQSFVVKIWLEEPDEETGRVLWRGRVTHVPGGEQRIIHTLDQIDVFIAPYLEAMGVALPPRRGAMWWVRWWRQ